MDLVEETTDKQIILRMRGTDQNLNSRIVRRPQIQRGRT